MGVRFEAVLEYDGDDPINNVFVCRLDEFCYPSLKNWDGAYESRNWGNYPPKKFSLETKKCSEYYIPTHWNLNKIVPRIKSLKKELRSNKELAKYHREEIRDIIGDLQSLYDLAMENCTKNDLNPDKCYIIWWINW